MDKARRVVAEYPMQIGGDQAFSTLDPAHAGPAKLLYRGAGFSATCYSAVFPNQAEAISASAYAISPDIGGFTDVVIVAPERVVKA